MRFTFAGDRTVSETFEVYLDRVGEDVALCIACPDEDFDLEVCRLTTQGTLFVGRCPEEDEDELEDLYQDMGLTSDGHGNIKVEMQA